MNSKNTPPHDAQVITVGSTNMDYTTRVHKIPHPGETVISSSFSTSGGGKGANSAIAAHHGGATSIFVTALGTDQDGHILHQQLTRYGVNLDYIHVLDDQHSGKAFISVDDQGENSITVVSGANALLSPTLALDTLGLLIDSSCSQVIQLNAELPLETTESVLEYADEQEIPAVFNIAPMSSPFASLIGQHSWKKLIIIVNEHEAQQLCDHYRNRTNNVSHTPTSVIEKASELAQQWGLELVLTLGDQGATLLSPGHEPYHCAAEPITLTDTVGAGDSFNGYFCAALSQGKTTAEAMKWALVGGATACQYSGAWPPIE